MEEHVVVNILNNFIMIIEFRPNFYTKYYISVGYKMKDMYVSFFLITITHYYIKSNGEEMIIWHDGYIKRPIVYWNLIKRFFTHKWRIVFPIIFAILMASCTAGSGNKARTVKMRIQILENNTISYVQVPANLLGVYKIGDTVWVDLGNHIINDTANYTMKGVLCK